MTRWNPSDGTLLDTIPVPADLVTCPVFGGKDLDVLYITTARIRLDEEALARQPHAGGLFAVRPGVCGMASHEFGG